MSQMRLLQSFGLQYVVASAPDVTLQFVKKSTEAEICAQTLHFIRALGRSFSAAYSNVEPSLAGELTKKF